MFTTILVETVYTQALHAPHTVPSSNETVTKVADQDEAKLLTTRSMHQHRGLQYEVNIRW